ncbi:MAG: U32 family peptidase [Candidatus Omnitrophica bacterium]|nr:U32 family peptidase [Candidatus Omnitrophota bacterium]
MITNIPELIAPVGDWPSLHAAVQNGAGGVYFGLKELNMRDNALSFEQNELKKIAEYAGENDVKTYLTLNAIVFDDEITRVHKILRAAKEAGITAVIGWDMSVLEAARAEGVRIHLSTQASVSNFEAVKYYAGLGVKRIVLARECSLDRIKTIIKQIKTHGLQVEIETFIHGALCISISGRCFMSEYLLGQSANRGKCSQPCRRKYHITDLEGEAEFEIEDGYVLSPKDVCTLPFIEKLIDAGIHAFKIEGRMRAPEYVATVTRVYHDAISEYCNGTLTDVKKDNYIKALATVYNRGFSNGFYFGLPENDLAKASGSIATKRKHYIGEVLKYYSKINVAEILVRNDGLEKGDAILVTGNSTGAQKAVAEEMEREHQKIDRAEKGSKIAIKLPFAVKRGDKLFKLTAAQ